MSSEIWYRVLENAQDNPDSPHYQGASPPAETATTTAKEAKELVQPGEHIVIVPRKRSKYGAQRVVYHCHKLGVLVFDSLGEYRRYRQLLDMEASKLIEDLKVQQPFEILEGFSGHSGERFAPVVYRADFTYREVASGHYVIEDFKGRKTDLFILKWKLLMSKYADTHTLRMTTKEDLP